MSLDPLRSLDPRAEIAPGVLAVLDGLIQVAEAVLAADRTYFEDHLALSAPGPFPALSRQRVQFYSERDRRRCQMQQAAAGVEALRLARLAVEQHFTSPPRTEASDLKEDR